MEHWIIAAINVSSGVFGIALGRLSCLPRSEADTKTIFKLMEAVLDRDIEIANLKKSTPLRINGRFGKRGS
jgi:hypothetical protein